MYKTIVPDLISINSNVNSIRGFYLAERFNYFSPVHQKLQFHYTLKVNSKIDIPALYTIRNGYYTFKDDTWYYRRHTPIGDLKFSYNTKTREFNVNRLYRLIPVEFGGILPVGRLIADIISAEIFCEGIVMFRGCALQIHGRNIVMLGLSFNGKTTLVTQKLKDGAKYIAEDLVLFDIFKNVVYPTTPFHHIFNFARETNRRLAEVISLEKTINSAQKIDKLVMSYNSTDLQNSNENNERSICDFIISSAIGFLHGSLARSFIFASSKGDVIFKMLDLLAKLKPKFVHISSYNYDKIFEE